MVQSFMDRVRTRSIEVFASVANVNTTRRVSRRAKRLGAWSVATCDLD